MRQDLQTYGGGTLAPGVKARIPGSDVHHLEGKRQGRPRGKEHVSEDGGQKAAGAIGRGGQQVRSFGRGGVTWGLVPRSDTVAFLSAPGAALSGIWGDCLPIVPQTLHFVPTFPPK